MADEISRDIPDLMARAEKSLAAVRLLIDNGYLVEAISRAYYSVFYAATALLHSEGITVSKHSAVIAQMGEHFARPGRIAPRFHRLFIDLFDERHVADYGGIDFTGERAEAAYRSAREFVTAVQEYLVKPGSA
jgi:uncharacterized protein (UPF0332 family)